MRCILFSVFGLVLLNIFINYESDWRWLNNMKRNVNFLWNLKIHVYYSWHRNLRVLSDFVFFYPHIQTFLSSLYNIPCSQKLEQAVVQHILNLICLHINVLWFLPLLLLTNTHIFLNTKKLTKQQVLLLSCFAHSTK